MDEPGETSITVRQSRDSNDLSTVFSPRMITIAELWEDYIVFTQVWNLSTTSAARITPDSSTKTSGLKIPLPEDASGVRVIQPREGTNVNKTDIYYQQPILPAGSRQQEGPSLVVRFSIKHDNASSLSWTQELPFSVESASIVIPQASQHERFPRLDVDLDVPICGDNPDRSLMCFENIRNQAEGVPMLEDVAVRVAGAGRTREIPSTMTVSTTGWPTPIPVSLIAAYLAGGLALLAIFGFAIYEYRHRSQHRELDVQSQLLAEKDRILDEALSLKGALDRAELLESEYEIELARLREELAVVERRLALLEGATGEQDRAAQA